MPRKHQTEKHKPYQYLSMCKQKQQYATEKAALETIADRELMNMSLVELSTYQCPSCNKWHLTRQKRLV